MLDTFLNLVDDFVFYIFCMNNTYYLTLFPANQSFFIHFSIKIEA